MHCYRVCELALCIPSSLGGCGKIIQHGRNGIIGDGALYRPELVHANEVVRVCGRACPHVRSHAPVCAAVGAGLLIMPRVSPPSKASCTGCVTPGSCYSVSLKDGGRTGGSVLRRQWRQWRRPQGEEEKHLYHPCVSGKPQRYKCSFSLFYFKNPPNCCFFFQVSQKSRALVACSSARQHMNGEFFAQIHIMNVKKKTTDCEGVCQKINAEKMQSEKHTNQFSKRPSDSSKNCD